MENKILFKFLGGKYLGIKKDKIKVFDMTCTSCETRVERAVKKLEGVKNAMASFSGQSLKIEYDTDLCNLEKIKIAIKTAGYSTESSNNYKIAGIFIIAAAIILIGNSSSGFDITSRLNGATYFVLFIVGVLTSIHCVGMCGGVMLSQSISKESKSKFDSIKPAILYNAGRVLSYTILGGIVGALGSVLSLSISMKAALQIFAGVFMIIMGLNMSGFGLFRKFNITLPWSACNVKKKPKTPFLVGVLNGLMPCGPLQTMQLYALGTGSVYKGALSMLLFSLGTVPLMLTFGALSGLISKGYTKTLLRFSGILIVVLGILMGTRGLALAGVNIPTASTLAAGLSGNNKTLASSSSAAKPTIENGVQVIKMTADGAGYTPNGLYVQKNKPVKWIIDGKALNSCNGQILVPSLNIQKTLQPGQNVIEFTPQDKDITFSCGMGMIRGVIKVVDNIASVDASKPDASIPAPSAGMPGCNMGGGTTAPAIAKNPSIYGNDLSKVQTSRIVHKAVISGSNQTVSIKGIGYEFEPLILVVEKNVNTTLSIDLNEFDNPVGSFTIASADTGTPINSFIGRKGLVNITTTFNTDGLYGFSKDGTILGAVMVVDNLKNVDLEKIRKDYIGN